MVCSRNLGWSDLGETSRVLSVLESKGVMPEWELSDIYKGMLPFMGLQWAAVLILYFFPQIILIVPNMMFGTR